jgi:hypothetical protein
MKITNKPLYSIVVLAISLVHAAPVDSNDAPEFSVVDLLPAHAGHFELGHRAAQVTAPFDTSIPHPANPHQVKIRIDGADDEPIIGAFDLPQQNHVKHQHHGEKQHQEEQREHFEDDETALEDEVCMEASQELAKHVISLRDYIDTLEEEEYSSFLDHYLDEGNEDDMLALELALELKEDDDGNLLEPVFDCEDALEYITYKQLSHNKEQSQGKDNRSRDILERELEQDLACSKEEMENGECESIEQHRQARHHHHQHQDRKAHPPREGRAAAASTEHLIHPGKIVRLTQADGFQHGENLTRPHFDHHPSLQDADLLGSTTVVHPLIHAQPVSSPLTFIFAGPIPVMKREEDSSDELMAKRSPSRAGQVSFETPESAQPAEMGRTSATA